MASVVFHAGLTDLLTWTTGIDFLADTIKVMLVDNSYTPDKDDVYVDPGGGTGAKGAEIGVSGYSRQTLGSKTIAKSNASDRVEMDAADAAFTSLGAGETIAAAVVYKHVGADDTANKLIAYLDLADTPTNGGNVTLQFASNGFLNINV